LRGSELRAHPAFDPDFSEIVDLREVEDLALKAADFLKLADEIDCFECEAWCAFVVHNSVPDHVARHAQHCAPEEKYKFFSSLEEARKWIESRPAHCPDQRNTT
jgi:hypothetical protein